MTQLLITFSLALCLTATLFSGCQQNTAGPEASEVTEDLVILPSETVDHIGLTTQAVTTRRSDIELNALGEIKADANRLFHINSLANGRIMKDNVMLGDVIRQGQTLALIENLDVVRVQADAIHKLHDNSVDMPKPKRGMHWHLKIWTESNA